MLLAQTGGDTAVQVTIITTAGLIIVAIIGVFTAKITSGARKDAKENAGIAKDNAEEATKAADIAKDYAEAAAAKDALLNAMEKRLGFVEAQNANCEQRLGELERRLDESDEQKRAASLLERRRVEEIEDLRAQVSTLKSRK